MQIISKKTFF